VWALFGLGRVEVAGTSMAPALLPGDRLLVRRTRRLRVGDLAVVVDPRAPARVLVKRVAAVSAAGVDVRGDNAAASTDSLAFGVVPRRLVRGRAWYRYAPAPRAGRLRRAER
jgi:nickel-type superoxide dismutase maturation protease